MSDSPRPAQAIARQIAEQVNATTDRHCGCCTNEGVDEYVAGRPVTNCKHQREARDLLIRAITDARRAAWEEAAQEVERFGFPINPIAMAVWLRQRAAQEADPT